MQKIIFQNRHLAMVFFLFCVVDCVQARPDEIIKPIQTPSETPISLESAKSTPLLVPRIKIETPTAFVLEATETSQPTPSEAQLVTPATVTSVAAQPTTSPIPPVAQEQSNIIAVTRFSGGVREIILLNFLSGETHPVSAVQADSYAPKWSYDGSLLAFIEDDGFDPLGGSLTIVFEEGTRVTDTPNFSNIINVEWSKSALKLLYTLSEISLNGPSQDGIHEIRLYDVLNRNDRLVNSSYGLPISLHWSPVEDVILVIEAGERLPNIHWPFLLTLDGVRVPWFGVGSPCYVVWHPSGQSYTYDNLLYPYTGVPEISSYNIDTQEIKILTPKDDPVYDPQWSPNGNLLAYVHYNVDGLTSSLFVADILNGSRETISQEGEYTCCHSWSLDGSFLAYLGTNNKGETTEKTAFTLYIYNIETGEHLQYLENSLASYRPAWKPISPE